MEAAIGFNRNVSEHNMHFKLVNGEELTEYFPTKHSSVREIIAIKCKRLVHYITTGVKINETSVCKWAEKHPDKRISVLFEGKAVQRKLIRHEHGMTLPKISFYTRTVESLKFLGEFLRNPSKVGAVLPSSNALAREIVKEIPKDLQAGPRLLLEVGPGTGIFSDKIIKRMNPTDELHLVEFDEGFCAILKEKYKHIPNVKVFHKSILDHTPPEGKKYDYVVSGLPLNAFEADFVEQVFTKFTTITRPNGKISYFEYMLIPRIKVLFSNAVNRENLQTVLTLKKSFHEFHPKGVGHVLLNVPSARVLHHEIRC
jgi:phospholipid N-methyltransferase